jgi:hypothetical protein
VYGLKQDWVTGTRYQQGNVLWKPGERLIMYAKLPFPMMAEVWQESRRLLLMCGKEFPRDLVTWVVMQDLRPTRNGTVRRAKE